MIKKVIFVVCLVFSFCCCGQKFKSQTTVGFKSLTPAEFETLIKEDLSVQLVDVRRPVEYDSGHIYNAVLINVLDSAFIDNAMVILDKSKPIAVYCRSGKRSKDAAGKLSEIGYKVFDLDSGYLGWVAYIGKNDD
jgi:Rhodanese-related sulfurtransferase